MSLDVNLSLFSVAGVASTEISDEELVNYLSNCLVNELVIVLRQKTYRRLVVILVGLC